MNPYTAIPLSNVLLRLGILKMSSNIKPKQWAAHGVQYKCANFASKNFPVRTKTKKEIKKEF